MSSWQQQTTGQRPLDVQQYQQTSYGSYNPQQYQQQPTHQNLATSWQQPNSVETSVLSWSQQNQQAFSGVSNTNSASYTSNNGGWNTGLPTEWFRKPLRGPAVYVDVPYFEARWGENNRWQYRCFLCNTNWMLNENEISGHCATEHHQTQYQEFARQHQLFQQASASGTADTTQNHQSSQLSNFWQQPQSTSEVAWQGQQQSQSTSAVAWQGQQEPQTDWQQTQQAQDGSSASWLQNASWQLRPQQQQQQLAPWGKPPQQQQQLLVDTAAESGEQPWFQRPPAYEQETGFGINETGQSLEDAATKVAQQPVETASALIDHPYLKTKLKRGKLRYKCSWCETQWMVLEKAIGHFSQRVHRKRSRTQDKDQLLLQQLRHRAQNEVAENRASRPPTRAAATAAREAIVGQLKPLTPPTRAAAVAEREAIEPLNQSRFTNQNPVATRATTADKFKPLNQNRPENQNSAAGGRHGLGRGMHATYPAWYIAQQKESQVAEKADEEEVLSDGEIPDPGKLQVDHSTATTKPTRKRPRLGPPARGVSVSLQDTLYLEEKADEEDSSYIEGNVRATKRPRLQLPNWNTSVSLQESEPGNTGKQSMNAAAAEPTEVPTQPDKGKSSKLPKRQHKAELAKKVQDCSDRLEEHLLEHREQYNDTEIKDCLVVLREWNGTYPGNKHDPKAMRPVCLEKLAQAVLDEDTPSINIYRQQLHDLVSQRESQLMVPQKQTESQSLLTLVSQRESKTMVQQSQSESSLPASPFRSDSSEYARDKIGEYTQRLETLLLEEERDLGFNQHAVIQETLQQLGEWNTKVRKRPLFPTAQERRTSMVQNLAKAILQSNHGKKVELRQQLKELNERPMKGTETSETSTTCVQVKDLWSGQDGSFCIPSIPPASSVAKTRENTSMDHLDNSKDDQTQGHSNASGEDVGVGGLYGDLPTSPLKKKTGDDRESRNASDELSQSEENSAEYKNKAKEPGLSTGNMENDARSKGEAGAAVNLAAPNDKNAGEKQQQSETDKSSNEGPLPGVSDSTKPSLAEKRAQAEAKLRQALRAKKQALERARQQSSRTLQPISALMEGGTDSLFITNIKNSGPDHMVHFTSAQLLDSYSDEYVGDSDEDQENAEPDAGLEMDQETFDENVSHTLQEKMTLLQRKMEIQGKLIEAREKKERLEREKAKRLREQQSDTEEGMNEGTNRAIDLSGNSNGEKEETPKLDREELLKRKKEAERKKALTHYLNLIAKQEYLLQQQEEKIQETKASIEECSREIAEAKERLPQTVQEIQSLTARSKVLDDMIAETAKKLVNTRKKLYESKNDMSQ